MVVSVSLNQRKYIFKKEVFLAKNKLQESVSLQHRKEQRVYNDMFGKYVDITNNKFHEAKLGLDSNYKLTECANNVNKKFEYETTK